MESLRCLCLGSYYPLVEASVNPTYFGGVLITGAEMLRGIKDRLRAIIQQGFFR